VERFPYKNGKNFHPTELRLGRNAGQGMEESLEQDAGLIRGCLSVGTPVSWGVDADIGVRIG